MPRSFVLPALERTVDDTQAISPDGNWLAYTAGGTLWIRNLGELQARRVQDSAGARGPFWSPDSDAVAFAVGDRLYRISMDGGRPEQLCRISGGDFTGGSWSASQGIVFSLSRANWDGDVLRVPAEGGEPEPFTVPDAELGERRLHQPHFLPDGRTLLYSAVTFANNGGEIVVERNGVRTHLGLGDRATQPAYSPTGHIVFTRSAGGELALWAVPFSVETVATQGEPFRIVASGKDSSFAADGTLVYGVPRPEPHQLVWVDRSGTQVGALGEPSLSTLWTPAISPDGRRVAATVNWDNISVWDADRDVPTRVTEPEEAALFAEWLPGGDEIAYSLLSGGEALMVRRADGSGDARLLLEKKGAAAPSISPDGAILAFYVVDPDSARDLWALEMEKPDEPFVLLRTPANEAMPRISPDGSLIAYQSDTSGRWEVYVQPFPEGEGRWQISTDGGQVPTRNPQGGELFFVSGDDFMAASFTVRPEVRVGTPRRLFSGSAIGTQLSQPRYIERMYDVAPDGDRFVVVKGAQMGTTELVLVERALEDTSRP